MKTMTSEQLKQYNALRKVAMQAMLARTAAATNGTPEEYRAAELAFGKAANEMGRYYNGIMGCKTFVTNLPE